MSPVSVTLMMSGRGCDLEGLEGSDEVSPSAEGADSPILGLVMALMGFRGMGRACRLIVRFDDVSELEYG